MGTRRRESLYTAVYQEAAASSSTLPTPSRIVRFQARLFITGPSI